LKLCHSRPANRTLGSTVLFFLGIFLASAAVRPALAVEKSRFRADDYQIDVEVIFANGDTVAAFGYASGSFQGKGAEKAGGAWRFPAAWKAVVREGKVLEWRVYADVEPMMRSMGMRRFE